MHRQVTIVPHAQSRLCDIRKPHTPNRPTQTVKPDESRPGIPLPSHCEPDDASHRGLSRVRPWDGEAGGPSSQSRVEVDQCSMPVPCAMATHGRAARTPARHTCPGDRPVRGAKRVRHLDREGRARARRRATAACATRLQLATDRGGGLLAPIAATDVSTTLPYLICAYLRNAAESS